MTHPVIRSRRGCETSPDFEHYTNVESRQEMGYRLNTFLNRVTGDPHIDLIMESTDYGKHRPSQSTVDYHARTAKNPYRVEVH